IVVVVCEHCDSHAEFSRSLCRFGRFRRSIDDSLLPDSHIVHAPIRNIHSDQLFSSSRALQSIKAQCESGIAGGHMESRFVLLGDVDHRLIRSEHESVADFDLVLV
ncbi:hypothetical protein PFISCL1PPCAC_26585, partial [Pristionchus fissidentatus]